MKFLFFIILSVYIILAFIGNGGWDYIETNADSDYLLQNWYIFLPVAVIGTALMYFLTIKAFPVTNQPKNKKLLLICSLIFLAFAFFVNTKIITLINCKGTPKETVYVDGILSDKDEFRRIKKRKTKRRITVQTENGKQYRFSVKTTAFNKLKEGEPFNKEFKVGALGILYRKE